MRVCWVETQPERWGVEVFVMRVRNKGTGQRRPHDGFAG